MQDKARTFVDGISDISLINGMIHIKCANLERPQDAEEKPDIRETVRLVVPINGFAQGVRQMNNMAGILRDRGVLAQLDENPDTGAQ